MKECENHMLLNGEGGKTTWLHLICLCRMTHLRIKVRSIRVGKLRCLWAWPSPCTQPRACSPQRTSEELRFLPAVFYPKIRTEQCLYPVCTGSWSFCGRGKTTVKIWKLENEFPVIPYLLNRVDIPEWQKRRYNEYLKEAWDKGILLIQSTKTKPRPLPSAFVVKKKKKKALSYYCVVPLTSREDYSYLLRTCADRRLGEWPAHDHKSARSRTQMC